MGWCRESSSSSSVSRLNQVVLSLSLFAIPWNSIDRSVGGSALEQSKIKKEDEMSEVEAGTEITLPAGTRVRIAGLTGAQQYNGLCGMVVGKSEKGDNRLVVLLDNSG